MATELDNIQALHCSKEVEVPSGGAEDVYITSPGIINQALRAFPPGVANPNTGATFILVVIPEESGAADWYVDNWQYVYNTPGDPTSGVASIRFDLHNVGGPNGTVDYRVSVFSYHSKVA